ncbi:hypothetical protein ACFL9T_03180 [Thermodesulfobacteriota bacterium]
MKKTRPLFISLFIITAVFSVFQGRGHGYIMPADQMIHSMVANFSHFKTLIITQSRVPDENQATDEQAEGTKERIWIKAPGYYHKENITNAGGTQERSIDQIYRQLLIANSERRVKRILLEMGIDLKKTALTRIDGKAAYRIGSEGVHDTKLVIDKEKFLPLLITYNPYGVSDGRFLTVRFKDFRPLEKGWYPFEILYVEDGQTVGRLIIHEIQVNQPIEQSLFLGKRTQPAHPTAKPEKQAHPPENERLRQIIKTFEKKYR